MPIEEASVLYGRLAGLAALIADKPESDSNELLQEFFDQTEESIRLHNGIILDFSGESFSAVFQEDHSQLNAVEAARECQEKISSLLKNKNSETGIAFKSGIAHAGVIKYSSPERNHQNSNPSFKLMGEAVDLSERLFSFAEDGQILVNRAVFDNTSGQWKYNKLEPLHIPGSKELLEVYELKEKKRKKANAELSISRQIFSDMVGRDEEIKIVEQKIKELVAGKGSIINIVGKAGIGKSRLMAEMKVQPIMEKVLLLEGRAISTGQNLSFHPITNLIKSWAEIKEDDIPSQSSGKLKMGIQRIAPEQSDEIYAFIATMMGLPLEGKHKERVKGLEGEALEKHILKNLRDLVIAATRDKPRIYLIEDLHWADSSSITLFESLYKLSRNYPVMFINVMRPGYQGTGDHILKHLNDNFPDDHTSIHIQALKEEESSSLIINLLRKANLPEEVRSMIIRKTEGNPFFIEEIIRSFIDEGIVEVKEGQFVVTEKIKEVNIPETINDAILSRVDKLDEKTRELLNTASVMGRNFYYKVLEEATDTIEELDERLSYLTEVQLISESKKKQEIEYLFKHALAQQLTYDSMMEQSRKETHFKIAQSIEKVFAANINEYYATLVYHYKMAENEEKIIQYLSLAGDEAMRSGASSEALGFFEEKLSKLPQSRINDADDNEVKDLKVKIASMLHFVGRNNEAINIIESVFSQYYNYRVARTERGIMIRGIIALLATVFIFKYKQLFFKKPIDKDAENFSKLICLWGYALATVNPKHFVFKCADAAMRFRNTDIKNSSSGQAMFAGLGVVVTWSGFSYKTSWRILEFLKAMDIDNNPGSLGSYYMTKMMIEYNSGNWNKREDFNRIFQTSLKGVELFDTTMVVVYYCLQNIELANYEVIQECKKNLNEIAVSFENSHAYAQESRITSLSMIKFRKLGELQDVLDQGMTYLQEAEHQYIKTTLSIVQTQLYIYNGNIKDAHTEFLEAKETIKGNERIAVLYTFYLIAKIQLELEIIKDQINKGENYNTKLRELLKESQKLIKKSKKLVGNLTEACLLRAKIFVIKKKYSKALKYLKLAIATSEKHNGRLELSRAYFETGKFLSDPNNKYKELKGQPAGYYLDKAKTMFEEMDLQWDLEQYEEYLKKLN